MAKQAKKQTNSRDAAKRTVAAKSPAMKIAKGRSATLFTEVTVVGSRRRPARDAKRERRIVFEIIVDAYTPEEQAMGWYCHLENELRFPFRAKCVAERAISPLRRGDLVEVIGMAPDEECEHEMFVMVTVEARALGVPLAQLKPHLRSDAQTKQAVADWHYWVGQGYRL